MDTSFEISKFDKILMLRQKNAETQAFVGFHTEKIEVARLDAKILNVIGAKQALQTWSHETSPPNPGHQTPHIRSITINVTQICNLHCAYCAAGGDGSFGDPIKKISVEKTLPQIQFFINKIPENGEFRMTFLGGEPLLYPEAIEMISEYAIELSQQKSVKIKFVVVTNGTLFSDKTLDVLGKIKPDMTISIDGDIEVNDKNRPTKGGQGSTLKVIEGLQRLLNRKAEFGRIGLSGVFGVMNSDLESAYAFYSKFSVDWFDFTYDHTETRSEISESFTKALEQIAHKAYQKGGEKELRRIKLFNTYFEILDSQTKVENYCGAGKSYLILDARNNLYTCPWVVGDSTEVVGSGTTLWQDKLAPYQNTLIETNNCQSCWARYVCGGGCMFMHKNKTGSKHQVDENFCNRTRYLIALSILYYEQSRGQSAVANG